MLDQRCFVQFIHPGGEHLPDQGDLKSWNSGAHGRKCLKSHGRYSGGNKLKEAEIVFWGEWEPESHVIAHYENPLPDGPEYLYEPFYES